MVTKKTITVDLAFHETGAVVEKAPGQFLGGVAEPDMIGFALDMWHEVADLDGGTSPSGPVQGSFQVSLRGNAEAYRELARYLLGVAELNTDVDPGFHAHHEIATTDGLAKRHIIVRKTNSLVG
jgi:hypothetical protein